jgi:hypothetical protein
MNGHPNDEPRLSTDDQTPAQTDSMSSVQEPKIIVNSQQQLLRKQKKLLATPQQQPSQRLHHPKFIQSASSKNVMQDFNAFAQKFNERQEQLP